MSKLKILLLPFGIVAELSLLLICWIVAFISPKRAKRLVDWCTTVLPDDPWYKGR